MIATTRFLFAASRFRLLKFDFFVFVARNLVLLLDATGRDPDLAGAAAVDGGGAASRRVRTGAVLAAAAEDRCGSSS